MRSGVRKLPFGLLAACVAGWGCATPSWDLVPDWPWTARAPELPPVVAAPPSQLPAPEGVRATSGEYREIPLLWDPLLAGDVGGYRIEGADEREGPYLPLADVWGRGVIAYADRGAERPLGDAVTRFYRIRAFTLAGQLSENASEVVVGTTAPRPDAPEELRAYSRQPREVPLSWRAAEDPRVAGYVVERSPSPDGPFEAIAQIEGRHATSYVDRGLGDLRVFYYRVAARNLGGAIGATSEPVRAVTKPEPLPPLGLRLVSRGLGANELAWEPNVEPDIVAYQLHRVYPDAAPVRVASVPGDRTSARDTAVGAGQSITYRAIAVDRDGLESRFSDPVEVTGVNYDATAEVRTDGVHLRWDPRRDEGFVRARVEREGWFGRRVLGTSAQGSFVDTDVERGGVYRYVLVLERPGAVEAPASEPIPVRVPAEGVR
jgi:fibronectin type 3 domain-containing protein